MRVRLSGGKLTVTDGPFTEAKEVVGGYAIFDAKSKADMLKWTKRFMDLHKTYMPGWEGECEVRQLPEMGAEPCGHTHEPSGSRDLTRLAAPMELALVGSHDGYRHSSRN